LGTLGRIVRNMVILFGSMVICQIFGLVTTIYTARVLGVEEFGKLNFAYTIVYYFGLLILPGMSMVAIREIAKSKTKEEVKQYIATVMLLSIALALVAFTLLVIFTTFFNRTMQIKYLIFFFGLSMLINSFAVPWAFQGIEKMQYSELPGIIYSILYMNLVLWFIKGPTDTILVPYLAFLVNTLTVMLSLFCLFRVIGNIRLNLNSAALKRIISAAVPLSLFSILGSTLTNIDKLILGFTRSSFELGIYASAYRFILIIHMIMRNYYGAMFPVLSRFYHNSFASFKKLATKNANIMFIMSLPIAFGLAVLGGPIISLVFGAKYLPAAAVMQILIWTIIFISINSLFSQGLIAAGRQNTVVILLAIQLVCTGGLSLIFVPKFGMKAAALAVVFGDFIAFLIYYKEFAKIFKIPIARLIFKPLLSSLVMVVFLKLYSEASLFFRVSIGSSVYLFSLILMRGLPWEDVGLAWNSVFNNKKFGSS